MLTVIDDLLSLQIDCGGAVKDMNSSDLDKLLASYSLAEQAKEYFLKQEITFDEYLQLLESHQVNVDLYMETVEQNLEELKLI